MILEGEGEAEIGDGLPERVAAGSVVAIPAGMPQRITNTGSDDLIFLAICTPRFRREIYQDLEDGPSEPDQAYQFDRPSPSAE